jgi:lysophospholipase L1-like esterase
MKVTLIGDSVGIDIAPYLQQYFPNLYVDAAVSRQFSEAKSIVQQLIESDSLGQAVIIELGSNGIISESHLRALIELIGSEINVVFINIQVPRSWCEGNNATLSKVCAEYANVAVADWYSVSVGQDEFFYSDDVHPNSIGSPILAKIVYYTVNRGRMAIYSLPFN